MSAEVHSCLESTMQVRTALLVCAAVALTACAPPQSSSPPAGTSTPQSRPVAPPPAGGGVDYQLAQGYPPAPGVEIVIRDHAAPPEPGLYNICYVNAFQAQPGAEAEWGDLVLRDATGSAVVDEDWGEALLDLRTPDKRDRVAAKVNAWIDECAAKGFQAVEPDNFDSFTRSRGLLSAADAQDFIRLLSAHAHDTGLAIGQKNTSELAPDRERNGLDFAVAEECGEQGDCDEYTAAFDDRVIVIEYTDSGLTAACSRWGDALSIVRRDRDVLPADEPGHLRETC
ncbi:endo alpha-1,4 polygalactosaminidase [Actinokineospora sp. PR83]|uniref:endo alpha-1,4 polygalactosaminidase n=1 Tax=Actinokineospora sp. PR83 TaxID=2884908 RepID=UPI0027E0AA94|nr:endo alpha-1,4 polygalactosaminidase [Actinokineospora sp. PR83]MCG8915696.1 endo alpha-1,4 polygalactosaminidase [Actinokineospora sp. PR83]